MHFGQVQTPAFHEVQDATRRTHYHLHPSAQLAKLLGVGCATINGQHIHIDELPERLDHLGYLQRQFTGWGDHQCLGQVLLRINAVENRQGEGGCFAGAGLSLASNIAAFLHQRDDPGLDRGRLGVPQRGDGLHQFGAQVKIFKLYGH